MCTTTPKHPDDDELLEGDSGHGNNGNMQSSSYHHSPRRRRRPSTRRLSMPTAGAAASCSNNLNTPPASPAISRRSSLSQNLANVEQQIRRTSLGGSNHSLTNYSNHSPKSQKAPPSLDDFFKQQNEKAEQSKKHEIRRREADHFKQSQAVDQHLEQRKEERLHRLSMAKQRIAQEEEQAAIKEEQSRRKQEEDAAREFASEPARRKRAYSLYYKWGMPNRKDFKAKLDKKRKQVDVEMSDIDLLPWTASGTMVDVSKMHSLTNLVNGNTSGSSSANLSNGSGSSRRLSRH